MKGKIKFINKNEGWGFITGEDKKDIFFHVNDFINKDDPAKTYDGIAVEYEIGKSRKGDKAINIRIIQNE